MADDERPLDLEQSITGRLLSAGGRTDLSLVSVWFAYQPVAGDGVTVRTLSDVDGAFVFDLPRLRLARALIGAEIEGARPVDLEPDGEQLEPGDLALVVDDIVPSHLRYAG